jgi:hypothetical protein
MPLRSLSRTAAALLLVCLCAACARAQDEAGEQAQLVALSSRTFCFERIGQFTTLRCGAEETGPDCRLFEQMDVSPQIDWDSLIEKARRSAPKRKVDTERLDAPIAAAYAVDRYSGPWRIVLSAGAGQDSPEFLQPFAARIRPDFPGYKVILKAEKVVAVEVLRDAAQWKAACKELGLDENGRKRKRRGLGGLFQ